MEPTGQRQRVCANARPMTGSAKSGVAVRRNHGPGLRCAASGLRTGVLKTRFVEPDQSDLPCPVPFAKIFRFAPDPNHFYNSRRPVPLQGRIAIVTDAGRDAVDAGGALDESC